MALLIVAACAWGFAELADEVVEGESHAFDTALLLALRNPADLSDPLGPGWVQEFGRDVTALGGVGILAGLTLAAAGFLWMQGRRRTMWLVLISVGGGQLLSSLFKLGFDRPRPDLVPHEAIVYTASFPSGHSMMAAVTYLTLGALLANAQPSRALKALPDVAGGRPDGGGRGQPGLSGGTLADRRAGRLGGRRRLGDALPAGRALAAAAGKDRAHHGGGAPVRARRLRRRRA